MCSNRVILTLEQQVDVLEELVRDNRVEGNFRPTLATNGMHNGASNQPSTLSSWSHWPRGPVDLKSYWPPGKSTGPHFPPTDVYIRD